MNSALLRTAVIGGLLLGCSSETGEGTSGGGAAGVAYPEGPHGLEQGDTIPNLTLVDPAGEPVVLDAYYRGDAQALLLYVTATWCFTCGPEIGWLNGYAPRVDGRFVAMNVLLENKQFEDADGDDAFAFGDGYGAQYPTLLDTTGQLDPFRDEAFIPLNVLVDTDTMKIALRDTGFDQALLEQEVGALLENAQ